MLKVNKYVKIAIVAVVVLAMLGVSVWVTGIINNNSYDIDEIDEWVEEPTAPTEAVNAEDAIMEDVPDGVRDLYNMDKGEMSDSEYAVSCALAILKYSPLSDDVESSNYNVKLLDGYWITEFDCGGYKVYVKCDPVYFQPIVFTFTREFTQDEREYFFSLGNATEVNNEDGTYTIYYI